MDEFVIGFFFKRFYISIKIIIGFLAPGNLSVIVILKNYYISRAGLLSAHYSAVVNDSIIIR